MVHSIALAVGLDVHAVQTHVAALDRETGELGGRRLRCAPLGVLDYLEGLGRPLVAVYEAGPTGFELARAAAGRGLEVRVAAPGLIPRGPADRVKTDRRDAERLARLLAAGELRFAYVPSVEQERFRDLVRAIEDARGDLMRARHRLTKFLLRRGERFADSRWTRPHLRWLERRSFDDAASRATFNDYLAAVASIAQRRGTLVAALEQLVSESTHAQTVARLRCFRGIDTLSAAGLCAEVSDFGRFSHPKPLSGFLGIVPSEHTSDQRRRQGAITKAGSSHGRRLLVEAAHHYRHRPSVGEELRRRQAGQDPRVWRDRLARAATPQRSLAGARQRARQARRRHRDRLRTRARRLRLGGRHARLTSSHIAPRPDAAGARTGQPRGPGQSQPAVRDRAMGSRSLPVAPASRVRTGDEQGS